MIEVNLDSAELRASVVAWSREFGETSNGALARLAARTGRHLALLTKPRGVSTSVKKKIHGGIEAGAKKTVVVMQKKTAWNKLKKAAKPRLEIDGQKWRLRKAQLVDTAQEIQAHVERRRFEHGSHGHPHDVPPHQRLVVPKSVFAKVLTARRKLAGKAKGGWMGAALAAQASAYLRGDRPVRARASWLKKHYGLGHARRVVDEERTTMYLFNKTRHADNLLDLWDYDRAPDLAWRDVADWYERAVEALDKKPQTT